MTPQEFASRLDVSRETLRKLSAYVALLKKWQSRINLISQSTLPDIWSRHIFDSGQLIKYMPTDIPAINRRILDIGSGAGFPGLVLSIIGAGEVQLVESDQRKAVFLQTVIDELDLSATIHNQRIEKMQPCQPHVITARAIAALPKLIKLITPQIHKDVVCLFLKGAKVEEELTNFQTYSNMIPQLYPSLSSIDGVVVKLTMPQ